MTYDAYKKHVKGWLYQIIDEGSEVVDEPRVRDHVILSGLEEYLPI